MNSQRTIAIGDIHGHLAALRRLAEFAAFNDDDRLISLGDYVDRGPDSAGVLDWLIERFDAGQLIPLRGNHDIMFLDALQHADRRRGGWLMCGGDTALESYGLDPARDFGPDSIPERHRRFLATDCRPYFETATHIFVHAGALHDRPMDVQPDWMLFWEKWYGPPPHVSGKTLVCGHTAQRSGWPLSVGHAVCIDTRVYGEDGWLTALDVISGRFWQARGTGETRSGWLDQIPDSGSQS